MKLKEILLNKRNIISAGVSIVTLITLTGCGQANINVKMYEKDDALIANINVTEEEQTENEIVDNKSEELNNKTEDVKLNDSSKGIVYEYINDVKSWKYYNKYYDEYHDAGYSYKIPHFNIDSSDADKLNKKIDEDYTEDYKSLIEYVNEHPGDFGGCANIEYSYHINGDVVSIVMESDWDGGNTKRNAYNINKKTGKEVTNAELLKMKGISEAEFPSKLSSIVEKTLKEYYSMNIESADFVTEQYKKTTSIENCSLENDMYLNVKGELCVIIARYNIAGGESTDIIICMDREIIYAQ